MSKSYHDMLAEIVNELEEEANNELSDDEPIEKLPTKKEIEKQQKQEYLNNTARINVRRPTNEEAKQKRIEGLKKAREIRQAQAEEKRNFTAKRKQEREQQLKKEQDEQDYLEQQKALLKKKVLDEYEQELRKTVKREAKATGLKLASQPLPKLQPQPQPQPQQVQPQVQNSMVSQQQKPVLNNPLARLRALGF